MLIAVKWLTLRNAIADPQQWRVLAEAPFVDLSRSRSALFRAFYVPYVSKQKNFWARYVLLERSGLRS